MSGRRSHKRRQRAEPAQQLIAPMKPGGTQSQYMRGEQSPFFFSWRPALRDSKSDVSQSYMLAAARTIDAIHNSGWLAGCVEQAKGDIIGGNGLRLSHKPDATMLTGFDAKELAEWSRMVERRFEIWSKDKDECDAGGKATFSQLQAQALDYYFSHGEMLALMPRVEGPNALSRVKVKLLPPHKLVQDTVESGNLFQGVTMGDWGYPLKYRITLGIGQGMEQDVDVLARTPANDRQVMHLLLGKSDQVRGVTPFVHVLRTLKQYDQLSDATLTKAMIDAIFAATVKSQAPTNDILQALQDDAEQGIGSASMLDFLSQKTAWYQGANIDLGRNGKVAHLYPGEELEFHGSQNISGNYEAFAKFLLREVARCVGLSFEDVTGDYSGATYSSVRMSSSKLWPLALFRRENLAARFCQEVFEEWLTEEIMTGRIPFKGGPMAYAGLRKFVTRADWRGPPKPQADDLKAAKAMEVLKRLGIVSDEILCSELGYDYEDVYEQRARERDLREQLDLPDGDTMTPDPVADDLVKDDA